MSNYDSIVSGVQLCNNYKILQQSSLRIMFADSGDGEEQDYYDFLLKISYFEYKKEDFYAIDMLIE